MSYLLRLIAFLWLTFIITPSFAVKLLPIEAFASIPDVSSVSLSPNGQKIISLVKVETKDISGKIIRLYDVKTKKSKNLALSENKKYIITDLAWVNNDDILVWASFPSTRNGGPVKESRLLKLNIKTGKVASIFTPEFMKRFRYIPLNMSNVIDMMPHDDEHILLSIVGLKNTDYGEASVIKVKIPGRGKVSLVQGHRANVDSWMTDYQSNVRIGIYRDKTQYRILERSVNKKKYRTLWQFEAFSKERVWPLAFGKDPNVLYIDALYQGKGAIYKVDLTDRNLTKELVYYNENYDVSNDLRRSHKSGEIIGVGNHFWAPAYKKLQASLDKALPDTDNYILSFDNTEQEYLLIATNSMISGIYLLGDRKANTLNYITSRYKSLPSKLMAKKTAIKYKARDGLTIEGFLTLPKDGAKKNLPTIIFPHGGPIGNDSDAFDYWTQFLANRGYAVFQMNFRGSSGYGHDFMSQGLAGWGQAMQDDVEDGTRWLIAEGIANKDKICILGASYGGYAALMGGVKTPELYQCIISVAGVTDIESWVKSFSRFTSYEVAKKQIGDDYDKLWEYSPLKHANNIKSPVLLIHGSKDRVVNVEHSEDMYDELKAKKKVVEFVELEGGDHDLSNNEHRLTTFKAMERFLQKYLPIKQSEEKAGVAE